MRRKWIRNRHSGCQVAVCLYMLVACLMMACCVSARALNTPPAGADGIVAAARHSQSYGNYLRLSHAKGEETLYAHMQYLYVRTGEVVKAGEPIGTVGQTGRATGAHLHLEWLCNGIRYDPAGIFHFL